ncbi:hypothetical protein GPECTOR_83g277 [Gonium pectorale]|uniref:Uncharacterized protein n=1 Tax=Gonium pectorale TaxID=33097 RepID=A0A150G2D0_GONPE|nr:hypothetical protein GPECTOR_83g277 [Gonium pectorale]|eukprot:KXZ43665.1 hypothetical protein GPECTOR_83g277 [Gonium pectorale]
MQKLLKEQGDKLRESSATPDQKLHIVRTCLQSRVAYTLQSMAYAPADIARLDRQLASIARRCYGIKGCFPTRAILSPAECLGLGVGSLRTVGAARVGNTLTLALNDKGRLGAVTRALLDLQSGQAGQLPVHTLRGETRYFNTLKRLAFLRDCGLELTQDGADYTPDANSLTRLWTPAEGLPGYRELAPLYRITAPLIALGADFHTLTNSKGTHLITADELAHLYGHSATRKHRVALNRLAMYLWQRYAETAEGQALPAGWQQPSLVATTNSLPAGLRRLPPDQLLTSLFSDNRSAPKTLPAATLDRFLVKRAMRTPEDETPAAQVPTRAQGHKGEAPDAPEAAPAPTTRPDCAARRQHAPPR